MGARLRKARERRGISLRQVADSTKISVPVLQALERDDISNLPGGLLGRGFVRSFAAAVHLDPEATVAAFVAQFPLDSVNDGYPASRDGTEVPDSRPVEPSFKIRQWPSTVLRLAAIGVLATVPIVYFSFAPAKPWPQWAALRSWALTAPARLTDNSVRAADFDERAVQVQRPATPPAESAAPAASEPVNARPDSAVAPAAPPGSDSTPVASPSPPTVMGPDSSPANGDARADASRDEMPEAATLVEEPPKGDAPQQTDEPLKVVLSVTSPSWVIATVDGKKALNRLLEVGEQEVIEASRELVLTAGDGGAVVMTLNGAMARSLARAGETVKVRLNRANFRKYLRGDDPAGESP